MSETETQYTTDQGMWKGPSPEEIRRRVEAAGPHPEHWARFVAIRAELFLAIARLLAEDGHCKSYEGAFKIHAPNYFEESAAVSDHGWLREDAWAIELHCYLIGPNRHYRWSGRTFAEALQKAEIDIRAWIAGDYTLRHDDHDY